MNRDIPIQVTFGAFIFAAVLLLLLPIQWIFAAVFAALVHEGFHAGAVLLSGGRIEGIEISSRGIVMRSETTTAAREIICALAGPVGSFLLVTMAQWCPRIAVCGLIHGLYNLLPLLPLDGGRVARGIFYAIFPPPAAHRGFVWFQRICLILMIFLLLLATSRIGIFPILFAIFILRGHHKEKALALKPVWRYNRIRMYKGENQ